jgi:putative NIF3 family GTP cyclohydrolase 1 type 2
MPVKMNKKPAKSATKAHVVDVLKVLDARAPFNAAADWDNVGLLLGDPSWPAKRVLITLDLTDAVAEEALKSKVDLVLAYHPPIFKPVARLTPEMPGPTRLLPELLAKRISIAALHTALDVAVGGTNDCLLDAFSPISREPLETLGETGSQLKLVTFVPQDEVDSVRAALSAAGAGVIGAYSQCSYMLWGRGTFLGDHSTNPTVGRKGRLETVDEVRLEMVTPASRIGAIVRALTAAHSYEEPAFDLYPLSSISGGGTLVSGGSANWPSRCAAPI